MPPPPTPPARWRWVSNAWALVAVVLTFVIYRCFQDDQAQSGTYGCEMSYMWPTYHQVNWPANPSQKYSLWLYREQGWDRDPKPSGHPVIFIPGNAGSYKQVRSIASSASRQFYTENGGRAQGMEDKTSLDFFAVDYNEDFSAFHAATLREQARFLTHSVHHVLDQYSHLPASARPHHVTLFGHSMGGIVARLALEELPGLIDVIMTMSTPHALPPVTLERDMDVIWNTIGRQVYNESSPLLFSICGGTADTQIASDACVIPEESLGASGGFTIFTTGMPGTWTSVEHQTMVWCHQVRWRVANVLLEITSRPGRQARLEVAEEWFLGVRPRSGILKSGGRRIPITSRAMSVKISSAAYDMASPVQWCENEHDCRIIDVDTTIMPAPINPKAPFPLPGEGVRPDEHAIVIETRLPRSSGWIELDLRENEQLVVGRNKTVRVLGDDWEGEADPTDTHLLLLFPEVSASSLLVHRLDLETPTCQGRRPTIRYRAASSPSHTNVHESRFFPNVADTIYLHSHTGSSPYIRHSSRGVIIDLYQEPGCQVTSARLSAAYGSSVAKIVIRYRMAAVAWIVVWVAAAVFSSMSILQSTGAFLPLVDTLESIGSRQFFIVAGTLYTTSLGAPGIILDAQGLPGVLAIACLLTWSFGAVNLLCKVLDGLLWATALVMSKVSSKKRAGTPPSPTPTPTPLRSVVATAIPFLLVVHFFIPHQMAFIILLVILYTSTVTEEWTPGRYNYSAGLVLLMISLVPFNAPILAVWGRNIWADYRHPFPGDYDALRVLPLLMLVSLCVSGRSPQPKENVQEAIKITLLLFATLTIVFGGRYTYIIPYFVDIIYIELAWLMI